MKIAWALVCAVLLSNTIGVKAAFADAAFQAWLQSLWPQAQTLGVSRATFDLATRGLEPDLSLPDLVLPGRPQKPPPGQAEFVQTPADYVKEASIERLAAHGRKLLEQYRAPLTAIERQFGVDPTVVLAIYGRETDFGRAPDTHNAIRVLATQGYLGKRKDKFREEFLFALKILQQGQVKLADMKSSWAGAMGLTQFLPSDYLKYAVDFDGDGRPDIWNSVPDALASAAKQLVDKGWQRGLRWAYEVHPPANVDCTIGVPENTLPIGEWLKRGFVPAYGRKLTSAERAESASLLQVAGLYGPSFLVTKNYFVIKEYNFSDLYVLFVGHLSDRMTDPRPFETPWGKVAQLPTRDLDRMQQILTERGYYHDKIDGKAGMLTRAALGAYQKKQRADAGLLADRRAPGAHAGGRPLNPGPRRLIVAGHGERQPVVVLARIAERAPERSPQRTMFDRAGDAEGAAAVFGGVARAGTLGHDFAGDRGRLADIGPAAPAHQIDVNVIVVIDVGARRQHGGEILARRPLHVVQEALLLGRAVPGILHDDPVAVGEVEFGDVERVAERVLGDMRIGIAVHAAARIGGDLFDLDDRLAKPV